MAVKVNIDLDREFTCSASVETVIKLLSNVPESATHFPKVDALTDLGDDTFRWEMEKIGLGGHSIQTVYACQYSTDESAGTVTWEPISGDGNGVVSGAWTVSEQGGETHVGFQTSAFLTLPLPGLLKMALSPLVKREFTSMVETYLENLQGVLSS